MGLTKKALDNGLDNGDTQITIFNNMKNGEKLISFEGNKKDKKNI